MRVCTCVCICVCVCLCVYVCVRVRVCVCVSVCVLRVLVCGTKNVWLNFSNLKTLSHLGLRGPTPEERVHQSLCQWRDLLAEKRKGTKT